jgi:signal transduction histidine kinase
MVVQRYVHKTILRTFRVWLALVVLSGCLLLLVGIAMIGRPIRRLIEKTRRVGAGDLEGPLCFRQHDEFAEVAAALNHMCEQLKTSQAIVRAEMEARMHTLEQLRHMDRLKTVGSLASGIAHELGTPLNVVSGRASLIASGRLALQEVADSARNIQEQVQRMTLIIRQLLDFARRKSPTRVTIDLRTLARHTLDMLMPLAAQQHAILTLQTDDAPVSARVDTGQMQQVLMNLVTNAWQAMPHGGAIAVGVHRAATPPPHGHVQSEEDYGCISVTDQGKGIPSADLQHILSLFSQPKKQDRVLVWGCRSPMGLCTTMVDGSRCTASEGREPVLLSICRWRRNHARTHLDRGR